MSSGQTKKDTADRINGFEPSKRMICNQKLGQSFVSISYLVKLLDYLHFAISVNGGARWLLIRYVPIVININE